MPFWDFGQGVLRFCVEWPAFVARGSWIVIRGWWLVIRGWWLVLRGSWLVVSDSWFPDESGFPDKSGFRVSRQAGIFALLRHSLSKAG